jgi:methyl-accepting chemotaxis protein
VTTSFEEKKGNGWGEWSRYVLRELERLSDEFKELEKFIDSVSTSSGENSKLVGAMTERLNSLSKRLEDISADVKTTSTIVTNLRVSVASRLVYGSLGGGAVTLIVKVLEYMIAQAK